jgi:hypothetical protein
LRRRDLTLVSSSNAKDRPMAALGNHRAKNRPQIYTDNTDQEQAKIYGGILLFDRLRGRMTV